MVDWGSSRAKQKRFVIEFIKLGFSNATQAAKNAGYSEKTAKSQANRLLTNVDFLHVQETIEKIRQEFDNRSAELSIASATEILQFLTRVIRREETNTIVINVSEGEQMTKKIPADIKDGIKAAELLGKTHGLWSHKSDDSDVFDRLDKVLGKIDSAF